jgi:hypothetical protein
LRRKLDPRASNGGIFLGLNGVVVKSHGGTDAMGFASALDMAIDMARADVIPKIVADRAAIWPPLSNPPRELPLREHRAFPDHRLRRVSAGDRSHQCRARRRVDTSDEWIVERTGIRAGASRSRRTTSDLALKAAQAALEDAR